MAPVASKYERRAEDDFDAPSPRQQRELAKRGSADDDVFAQVYEDGRKAGAADARPRRARGPARGNRSRSSSRRPVAKRAQSKLVNEMVRPLRPAAREGTRLLALTLLVVALYLVLSSADTAAGVIGAGRRAVAWLLSSDRSIPYYRDTSG